MVVNSVVDSVVDCSVVEVVLVLVTGITEKRVSLTNMKHEICM